jgi:hypothetical protein
MEAQALAAIVQFGAAGLIGWMWLTERRSAMTREQQLSETHSRLLRDRETLEVLVAALRDNTRASAAIEAGQRAIADAVSRLAVRPAARQVPRQASTKPRRRGSSGRGSGRT